MKFKGEVLEVANCGDTLKVRVQMQGERDAQWRSMETATLTMPFTDSAASAYHVGRRVSVEIKALARHAREREVRE
jgi:hypothetical protein